MATERRTAPLVDDSPIGRVFASGASDIQVEGEGTVIRVLPDDLNGPSGLTCLSAMKA